MTDTEKFQAWADKGHWTNWERKPERTEDLKHLVRNALIRLEAGTTMGSTKLVDMILPGIDDHGRAYITVGLNYLRKHKLVEGCFIRGDKNPRTFGHKSVLWVNPTIPYVGFDKTEEPLGDGTEGLEGLL